MPRKMKDSGIAWVGQIPEDWEVTRGKYFMHLLNRPVKDDDGVITCFRDGEVTLRSKRREEGFTFSLKECGYQGVEPGDLVVHGMDGFAGSIGISDSRGKASPVLNVIDSCEDKSYIMYYLRSLAYRNVFQVLSTGIRVRSCDLRWSKLANLKYILPPLTEQKRIAEYLDKTVGRIDSLREKISREIERLGDYKKSMISEAVCRGLDKTAKMKDSGIPWVGMIPEGWEAKKIKYFFKATNTRGNSCLQLLSATQKYGMYPQSKLEGVVQVAEKTDLSTFKTVHVDDFVISLRSFQGGIERSDYEGVCSPAYQTFHATTEINTLYFKYLFKAQGFISALNAITVGIREGKTINYSDVQNMCIPRPPLAEQKRIAEYIDKQVAKIDALIEKRKAELERLEALKRSIICECVTGKMEVA